jgi:hypothetical protein
MNSLDSVTKTTATLTIWAQANENIGTLGVIAAKSMGQQRLFPSLGLKNSVVDVGEYSG